MRPRTSAPETRAAALLVLAGWSAATLGGCALIIPLQEGCPEDDPSCQEGAPVAPDMADTKTCSPGAPGCLDMDLPFKHAPDMLAEPGADMGAPAKDTRAYSDYHSGRWHRCGILAETSEIICEANELNITNRELPPAPKGIFTKVGVGLAHACALASSGAISCWGRDTDGPVIAPEGTFKDLDVGSSRSCAIRADGTALCWGWGARQTKPEGSFEQISAGLHGLTSFSFHDCGVRSDGTIACWGDDGSGQASPPAGQFRQVSAGDTHTCAIRTEGTVTCWGSIVKGPSGAFSQISAGLRHTCGVREDGTLACWGDDPSAQPVPEGRFLRVSSNYDYNCARREDNRIICWGRNAPE